MSRSSKLTGAEIARRRRALGLRQFEFAIELQPEFPGNRRINASFISFLERGHVTPDAVMAQHIAAVFERLETAHVAGARS